MATSEIEKLERRYAENPHGLTFAPLAEVHRKIGDIPRALELLTAGLELHPNYIPASIVLGRCHQDLGDLSSAEDAFAHVLRLDDENVIALKSLADINERQERYAEAETWLRRLVAIDRSNDEAREQLQRVEAARQSGTEKEAVTSVPVQVPVEAPAPAAVLEMIDLTPAPAAATRTKPKTAEPARLPADVAKPGKAGEAEPEPPTRRSIPEAEADTAEPVREPTPRPARYEAPEPDEVDAQEIAARAERLSERPGASEPEEASRLDEPVQPLPGLISAEFEPPLEATGGLGVETSEEVVLEVSGNSEFQVPDASEDLRSAAARPDRRPPQEPAQVREPPSTPAEIPAKIQAEPEFVVTETMAEVLLKQGHPEEALRVYRELARRNGGSPTLEARIRELESGAVGQPPMRRSYLARETNGQSVGAFFHTLLAARIYGPSGAGESAREDGSVPGAPQNGAGLVDAGYGEEQSLPVPPAVPSLEPQTEAAVSFDDFFNSESGESKPMRPGKGNPGEDDLDQFQTWLQNLKR